MLRSAATAQAPHQCRGNELSDLETGHGTVLGMGGNSAPNGKAVTLSAIGIMHFKCKIAIIIWESPVPSTAEVFQQKGIVLRLGDPNRVLKIRAFGERLVVPSVADKLPGWLWRRAAGISFAPSHPCDGRREPRGHRHRAGGPRLRRGLSCGDGQGLWPQHGRDQGEDRGQGEGGNAEQASKGHQQVWGELDKIREQLEEQYQDF